MILSIHIPKSGGTSFGHLLESTFGARLLRDYGDRVGLNSPEENRRRAARIAEARGRREELLRDYDVIHGHYTTDEYAGLFSNARFVAFFREPCQQTMSQYEYFLRHPEIDNPAVKLFHEVRATRAQFIAGGGNQQAVYLGTMELNEFAVVGLMEQCERSVALFEAVFGRKLLREPRMRTRTRTARANPMRLIPSFTAPLRNTAQPTSRSIAVPASVSPPCAAAMACERRSACAAPYLRLNCVPSYRVSRTPEAATTGAQNANCASR